MVDILNNLNIKVYKTYLNKYNNSNLYNEIYREISDYISSQNNLSCHIYYQKYVNVLCECISGVIKEVFNK